METILLQNCQFVFMLSSDVERLVTGKLWIQLVACLVPTLDPRRPDEFDTCVLYNPTHQFFMNLPIIQKTKHIKILTANFPCQLYLVCFYYNQSFPVCQRAASKHPQRKEETCWTEDRRGNICVGQRGIDSGENTTNKCIVIFPLEKNTIGLPAVMQREDSPLS